MRFKKVKLRYRNNFSKRYSTKFNGYTNFILNLRPPVIIKIAILRSSKMIWIQSRVEYLHTEYLYYMEYLCIYISKCLLVYSLLYTTTTWYTFNIVLGQLQIVYYNGQTYDYSAISSIIYSLRTLTRQDNFQTKLSHIIGQPLINIDNNYYP